MEGPHVLPSPHLTIWTKDARCLPSVAEPANATSQRPFAPAMETQYFLEGREGVQSTPDQWIKGTVILLSSPFHPFSDHL